MRKVTRDNVRWLAGLGGEAITTAFNGRSHIECSFRLAGTAFHTRWTENDTDTRMQKNWRAQVLRLIGGEHGKSRSQA